MLIKGTQLASTFWKTLKGVVTGSTNAVAAYSEVGLGLSQIKAVGAALPVLGPGHPQTSSSPN